MSGGLDYDAEASRRLETMYVTDDVVAQRRAVIDALGLRAGERVLDVGSGPGFLAAEIAAAVGDAGAVVGVDISDAMVTIAARRCAALPNVHVEVGDALDLRFEDDAFDVVVSTQVLEYVSEPVRALAQMYRVVRPGGRIGILATDWDSIVWHGPDPALTARILAAWQRHCAEPHLPRTLGPALADAGLDVTERRVIPLFNPETCAATYSGALIDLVAAFVAAQPDIDDDDVAAWVTGLRGLAERGAYFFSLNRYLFVATRPA